MSMMRVTKILLAASAVLILASSVGGLVADEKSTSQPAHAPGTSPAKATNVVGAKPPIITNWSNTKTANQKIAFLANKAERIKFSITVSGKPDAFIWRVNGKDQSNDKSVFSFTVPSKKNIWRISVETVCRKTITADGVGKYKDLSLKINYPDRLTWIVATTATGTANVSYSKSKDSIVIANGWTNPGHIANSIKDASIIEKVSPRVWLVKKKINVTSNGQLYINGIDTDEIRLLGENVDAGISSAGFISIGDVIIKSWNRTAKKYENNSYGKGRPWIRILSGSTGELQRNTISGLAGIRAERTKSVVTFYHNNITECQSGITYVESDNIEVCHNKMKEIFLGSISNYHKKCNNILIFNNTVGSLPKGGGAISVGGGKNIIVAYNTVTSSGWNGIAMSQSEYSYCGHNEVFSGDAAKGKYVIHNGMDWHGAKNSIAEYNYIHDLDKGDNGYYIDGSTVELYNITFRHNVVRNVPSRGMAIDNGHDCAIIDLVSQANRADGIQFYASAGYKCHTAGNWNIIDSTITGNGGNPIDLDKIWGEYRIVNTKISNTGGGDCSGKDICLDSSSWKGYKPTIHLINSNSTKVGWIGGNNNGVSKVYYYLDVKVVDKNGNPVEGATVTVKNIKDPSLLPISMNDTIPPKAISVTRTGPDGHTPLPKNKSGTLAIMESLKTPSKKTLCSYKIIAKAHGCGNSTTVKPDDTWYRSNPNKYQNTVTIVLPISQKKKTRTGN